MSVSHIRILGLFELTFYIILNTFPACCLTTDLINYFTLLIVYVLHFTVKSEYEVLEINNMKAESRATELLKRSKY